MEELKNFKPGKLSGIHVFTKKMKVLGEKEKGGRDRGGDMASHSVHADTLLPSLV